MALLPKTYKYSMLILYTYLFGGKESRLLKVCKRL